MHSNKTMSHTNGELYLKFRDNVVTDKIDVLESFKITFFDKKKRSMVFMVKDKICIVTGSAQGIGKEIAKRLLDQGGKVCISDVNDTLCEETAQGYQDAYGIERVTSFR